MKKLKYYIACSVDGFIAREDGSLDGFLTSGDHVTDYIESLTEFDVVLMGRKTYEVGLKEGVTNPYPMMKSYVFSRTLTESPDEKVTIVSENAIEWVKQLKKESGKSIYLCGGATLATILLSEKLIDDIILKINPFLIGAGIPLFLESIEQSKLVFSDKKIYKNGVLLLHYRVN